MSALDGMGGRLAELITNTGLSQNEFSTRLGVSPGFMSDVVRGIKKPGAEFLFGLHQTYSVSVDWLLSGTGTMYGGSPIELGLFKLIVAEIALARAAMLEADTEALQLVASLLAQGAGESLKDVMLMSALQEYASSSDEHLLAAVLYNSHLWTAKPDERIRNALSGAMAHFQAKQPLDILSALKGSSNRATKSQDNLAGSGKTQVITGKSARVAGRDFIEKPRPPKPSRKD